VHEAEIQESGRWLAGRSAASHDAERQEGSLAGRRTVQAIRTYCLVVEWLPEMATAWTAGGILMGIRSRRFYFLGESSRRATPQFRASQVSFMLKQADG